MDRLPELWSRHHPRRVTFEERCIRLDGRSLALWDHRNGRALPAVDPALRVSEERLGALLEQLSGADPAAIALAIEVRLESLQGS